MARTSLSVQEISRTGLDPAYEAANGDGEKVVNDGKTFVHVINGGGSPITVTVQHPGTVDGLAVADLTVTVTNAEDQMIGPFPGRFNQVGTDVGQIYVDFSGVTTVTVAAIRL